jgi:hypothetical protein
MEMEAVMPTNKFVKVAVDTFTLPLPDYANMYQVSSPRPVVKNPAPVKKDAVPQR